MGFLNKTGLQYLWTQIVSKITSVANETLTSANTYTDEKVASMGGGGSSDNAITSLSAAGTTITYTKGDGTSGTITTQDTTYAAATSSALGLVKSGGDVTISTAGVISVNDDSHNHTIANVDNLQTTLDGKVPTSRTINGKALSTNITLSASDVSAYTKTEIDNLIGDIETLLAAI